jgi:hypothetical protein
MTMTSEVITNFIPNYDTSKHSAAYKLFHYKFICAIAHMHLHTQEHTEVFGYVTSGDAATDRAQAQAEAHVQLTVAAMAEFHHDGIPFRLVSPDPDAVKIYNLIYEHLSDWKKHMDQSASFEAPLDDLRKFDALAGEVYQIAKFYMATAPQHGALNAALQTLLARRGGMRRHAGPAAPEIVRQVASTHTPMADSIAKEVTERKKSWR